ncbi:hypothetical protein N7G274_001005 [Stereocaulon virgatum]|uniref:Uncharacterized protein n=1 Tax=Stereocaulon virgatum TaxID=373712 RepID=A0ABR4AML8_9LECA
MVKKLLKLLGLARGKKERRESRVGILKEASHFGNGDGATSESDTARSPSDVSRHDYGAASVPAAAQSPDDEKPTATTTAKSPPPKKSYWEQAAKKLQREDPDTYKALTHFMNQLSPDARISRAAVSMLIDSHRSSAESGQRRPLFFKFTSDENKHRMDLKSYVKLRQIYVDYALTVEILDQVRADIPWAGFHFIKNAVIYDCGESRVLLAGVANNALMIAGYAEIEAIYRKDQKTKLDPAFETALIDFYTSILVYRVKAASHCEEVWKRKCRGPLRRLFNRESDTDQESQDWDAMQQTIDEKHAVCKRFLKLFDSPDPQVADKSLHSILETFGKRRAGAVRVFNEDERGPPPYTASTIPEPVSIWEQTLANL